MPHNLSHAEPLADASQLARRVAELAEHLQAGKEVDLKAWCGNCPEQFEQLEMLLPTLQAVVDFEQSMAGTGDLEALAGMSAGTKADGHPSGVLGDYRILSELGRGGMGVVYEAEQLSLGRRVALKVLPFAAMLDKQQLARFKNEARAAATLDHPNIVAIYSVGTERGVHYYAMQLIEGLSLAQVISARRHAQNPPPSKGGARGGIDERGLPINEAIDATAPFQSPIQNPQSKIDTQPVAALSTLPDFNSHEYFRTIARLGVQAAEALDHAHASGVLHRDVKPGNLMVDEAGKLWITDFGLARIEQDAGMTMTGDLVGTLRYMSPEQALANRVIVDHRCDIYSLGATLYELLTLRPAYSADDRQELLRQIAFEEPRKPRQINARIPQDVETIVLKAIEKNPTDRYGTARELAHDLQRFLKDQPILARRPNLPQRALKFSRRHHSFVMMLIAGLALGSIALAVSTVIITTALGRARQAEQRASTERDRFRVQRDQAEANLYVADMRLAHTEWQQSHLTAVDALLAAHLPRSDREDVRGWEWHYLQSLCDRDTATLSGHSGAVSAVAWSPDGQRLATAGDDCVIRLWDAVNVRELATLRGHTDQIRSLSWSPDGSKLASAGLDKAVRVWNLATGSALEIPASEQTIRCVAWSPDGKRLASCGNDGLVKIWDAVNGDELLRLDHLEFVWSVAWSPDGRRIASVGNYRRREMRIWDADDGKLIHAQLAAHGFSILAAAWSPDGKRLATASMDQHIKVWDTKLWTAQTFEGHNGTVMSISWSPSGDVLASGSADGTVNLWDAKSGGRIRTLRGHRGGVNSVHWRRDGNRLASASDDGKAKIWDPHADQECVIIKALGDVSISPDGRRLASVSDEPGNKRFTLQIRDATTGLPVGKPWQLDDPPLADDRDGLRPGAITWSPSGKQIAYGLASRDDPEAAVIKILDVQTRTMARSLSIPKEMGVAEILTIAWSPDSSHLAVGGMVAAGDLDPVIIWDVSSGDTTATLSTHSAPIESVAWNPDGSRLATASWDNMVKVWDTSTWRETAQFDRHPDAKGRTVAAGGRHIVAWSPDGSVLAAGTMRGWVVMWDQATGRELRSFSAHTAQVRSIAFSPDGARLATASQDHTVKIWDVDAASHLLTLKKHPSTVYDVAWSADGARLLSSGYAESLIWDASKSMNSRSTTNKVPNPLSNQR